MRVRAMGATVGVSGLLVFAGSVLGLAGVAAGGGDGISNYDGYTHVRVWPDDAWEVGVTRDAGARLLSEGFAAGRMSEWIVDDAGLETLEASGVTYVVIDREIESRIRAERERIALANEALALGRADSWFSDYKSVAQIETRLDELLAAYPELISEEQVGTSVDGMPIWGYTITSPVGGDADSKPGLMFNSTIHAREWVTPMAVMYIIENLVEDYGTDPRVTRVMDELVWYIIPVLNPDGYSYAWTTDRFWRKNRRDNGNGTFGVDLNRNWPVGFGGPGTSLNTASDVYPGPFALSEPESIALRDWVLAKPNVEAHIDFHSYSALVLWPIGYQFENTVPEPDLSNMVELSFLMSDAIFDTTGYTYAAINSAELYPAGGVVQDWVYEGAGVYSWTFELRPETAGQGGFVLPAAELLPAGQENYAAVLALADALVDGVRVEFLQSVPSTADAGSPVAVGFTTTSLFDVSLDGASGAVYHRAAGSDDKFEVVPAVGLGDGSFDAEIPGQACGTTTEFYVEVSLASGATVRSPSVEGEFYDVAFAAQSTAVEDAFESPSGWTVGAPGDTASTGVWELAVPQATDAQPGADTTVDGTRCWVTQAASGASVGTFDIDGGATSLLSPVYDLSAGDAASVRYSRWYNNSAGASPNEDVLRVFVSNNGGATWEILEEVGPGGSGTDGGWVTVELSIDDVVALTDAVRFMFVAEDSGGGSIVEAALDDFSIVTAETCCAGDTTGDGVVGPDDLFELLSVFGSSVTGGVADGDLTGDGAVGPDDLFELLSLFGVVCG